MFEEIATVKKPCYQDENPVQLHMSVLTNIHKNHLLILYAMMTLRPNPLFGVKKGIEQR